LEFKDYFSSQSKEYSKYRPKYPPELFEYLSSLVKEHNLAWDSATGNGQAALGLVPYFEKVIATDASESQISNANPHVKIEYRVAASENCGLEDNSIDLVTVATAIHWIDTDKFYSEVRRVLKPGGVIAVWNYVESNITPEIDNIMKHFAKVTIGKHWPRDNYKVWDFEELINFPFERIKAPDFKIERSWNLQEYLNYLYTWSATQNYIRNTGINPLEELHDDLIDNWGGENIARRVTWHLQMKVGRV
jgi:ubiquinone/menaquinone biosynthesis C-methylase UbiE